MANSRSARAATADRSACWADITFGQLREAKDVQFDYSGVWIEREAVIGDFNESDLRSAADVRNHRVLLGYQTHQNVTAQWTMWLGKLKRPFPNASLIAPGVRSACTTAPFENCRDSMLNRMQLALIYKLRGGARGDARKTKKLFRTNELWSSRSIYEALTRL